MVSAVDTGTLLKPSSGPPPTVAQPATAPPSAATPDSGAKRPPTAAPRPPRNSVRRDGSLTSWMLGLVERLLSSIEAKSLATGAFLR